MLEIFQGIVEPIVKALIGSKLGPVINGSSPDHLWRMLYMKHLVIQNVFGYEARHLWAVQRAADRNSPVYVVVMSEHAPCSALAPRKNGTRKRSTEIVIV